MKLLITLFILLSSTISLAGPASISKAAIDGTDSFIKACEQIQNQCDRRHSFVGCNYTCILLGKGVSEEQIEMYRARTGLGDYSMRHAFINESRYNYYLATAVTIYSDGSRTAVSLQIPPEYIFDVEMFLLRVESGQ